MLYGQHRILFEIEDETVTVLHIRHQRRHPFEMDELADLDAAIERVLGMADAYFENNWRDCNEREQAVLRGLAVQQADGLSLAERQRALLGLSRKELVEQHDEQWQLTVE